MCSFVHKVVILLVLLCNYCQWCHGTSVTFKYDDIVTKTKVELKPVHITCSLNEVLLLTTPIVNCMHSKYHLRKPNGDILRTNISTPKTDFGFNNYPMGRVILKYINKQIKAIYPSLMLKIINLATQDESVSVLDYVESNMNENDFMVGPLMEEDHGNWVLSIYCQDIDGDWIEMFQVITVEIISYVEMTKSKVELPEGSTFNLSFMYPINSLETCELNAPKSVTDRFFDRDHIDLDRCGYVIKDIKRSDEGMWRIIGVGKIVYEGVVDLTVTEDKPREKRIGEY